MKLRFLLIALFTLTLGFAQNKGTITGTITDQDMDNETLPFATVVVKGTNVAANADENGNYTLNVNAGTHTLVFAFLGYHNSEVQVTIKAGETKTINQPLKSTSVQLADVVIEKVVSREKETALLQEQKNAAVITQTIGAQEMSRKGVSNAEGAVTKVTGVSKQQGEKNVFVRGLGDRYNSTTLNGLPLPSEDPEYKNISLDFFSSDIIKNIAVNKTFSSDIYGDVGGANINIISKELSGDQNLEIGVSTGVNTQTLDKNFLTMDGGNYFGTVNKNSNISDLTQYTFKNNLNPNSQSLQTNTSFGASGGKKFNIGDNTLSMFLVATQGNSYRYREGVVKQTNSLGVIFQDQDFKRYVYNVAQTFMGNFKYKFGSFNSISFNSLYIHSNTQSVGDYIGANAPEATGELEFLRRQQMNDNNLWVNQLLSTLKLTEKVNLDLGASYSMIRTSEPDRRSNSYLFRNGTYRPSTNSGGNHERYFADLDENDYAGKAVATYKLSDEKESKIDVGYNFRYTTRLFESTIFNHRFSTMYDVDVNNADGLFNQNSLDNGVFDLQTGRGSMTAVNVWDPFWYDGTRTIHAALATFTHSFNPALTMVVGGRFEKVNQEVEYDTNIAQSVVNGVAKIDENYILPNLNLKYSLNEKHILRAAASMSYTLPQFKEVAPFKYSDINFSSQGNPDLKPSENFNADIKWEFYPESDELIAITGFYKHIKNPIARSEIPSGGNTLTYLNTGSSARGIGVELEVRKNIYKIEAPEVGKETVLSGGVNVSYLNSEQKLENSLPQFTNDSDMLQGASPVLVNADLTFRKTNENFGMTTSAVFNYFSDRIYSVGTRGFENIIEKGIPTLDLISQFSFGKSFALNLKARNLLNPDFQLTRESAKNANPETTLSTYKLGLDFSIGFTYKF